MQPENTESQLKVYAEKILDIAPCTRDFTKTEVLRHLDHGEAVRFADCLEKIYAQLFLDNLLQQAPDRHPNWVRMTKKGIDKKFSGIDPDDFTIDRILLELYHSPDKKKFYSEIRDENFEYFNHYKGVDMSRLLLHEDLIIWKEEAEIWQLSPKGRRTVREGGWINFNEVEKLKNNQEKNLKYYQYRDAKFRYYAFWPVFVFALIGGIYSTIKIVESTRTSEITKFEETKKQTLSAAQKKISVQNLK